MRSVASPPADRAKLEILEHNTLSMLREYEQAHPPVTGDDIADALERLASLFGVGVPERMGVELYAVALSAMPRALLPTAMIRVASTHKFSSLPMPADLLKAVETEMKIMKRERAELAKAYRAVRTEIYHQMREAATPASASLDNFGDREIKDGEVIAMLAAYQAETAANVGTIWTDPDATNERMTV